MLRILSAEEGPPTTLRLSFERKIVARQSSRTETAQPILSNDACAELRRMGFDETAVSTGATSLRA